MSDFWFFLDNYAPRAGADSNSDLTVYCIMAGAIEIFDSKILFDPLEEQFNIPTFVVSQSNTLGFVFEVVGKKVSFPGEESGNPYRLIASQTTFFYRQNGIEAFSSLITSIPLIECIHTIDKVFDKYRCLS